MSERPPGSLSDASLRCSLDLRELQLEHLREKTQEMLSFRPQLVRLARDRLARTGQTLQGQLPADDDLFLLQAKEELSEVLGLVTCILKTGELRDVVEQAQLLPEQCRCPICSQVYLVETARKEPLQCGQHVCVKCRARLEVCPFCRGACV